MDLRADLDMECKEKFLPVLGTELTELYLLDIFLTEEILMQKTGSTCAWFCCSVFLYTRYDT